MQNLQELGSAMLLDQLVAASGELGILQVSDAPSEELQSAQRKVDRVLEELQRRLSW